MTSRPPTGAQPRQPQPQRPQSSSTLSLSAQRPSHQQRNLAQQYPTPSPIRKDAVVDLTSESADPGSASHATTPKRAGSRLRLELSNEHDGSVFPDSMSITNSPLSRSPALSKASQQDLENPPMPMPKRRPHMSHPLPPQTAAPAPPAKKDTRPKPYVIETPPAAPRYSSTKSIEHVPANRDPFSRRFASGHADFFPWGGNHHEDEWSTEAIIKGTWDRGSQNETSSARLAIFPALKQKSGLNALSTIFMGVMNQRRHGGQITAPSTFKPPPRVTLTDTKREIWLKDLANPAISLRRLSRTIPHGIRGRTLLDQCLNKNVPTERAVWLAKCVGANEIRAFKRKGVNGAFVMGGELKWIRDWTVFVEQFVDAIVSGFGEADWKAKVTYAIRLATCLYSEHLLDRDHYLDWMITGLKNSTQSRIPMWILITQIFWTDLLRSRKYGRRLVFSLLAHLYTIYNDPDQDIFIQLSNQITSLLRPLLLRYPENLLCPNLWLKYRTTLKSSIQADDEACQEAYDKLNLRNTRLLVSTTASTPIGQQRLVQLLDSTFQSPMDRELSKKCWACSDNKPELLKTVVEWAISMYRPGLAKVYVAATLIRTWSALRINATAAILSTLDDVSPMDKARKQLVYHLVTALVRSGHFRVPQYHQWLMARGGYRDASDIDPDDGPCATRLLIELPLHCLPEEEKLQRKNLLRRAGDYSTVTEGSNISTALKCVDDTLGFSLGDDDEDGPQHMPLRKLLRRITTSSKALQSCVGAHLRYVFISQVGKKPGFVLSPSLFTSTRAILEATEDYAILSDVLKACSREGNIDVLASCVDTINAHLQILLAVGSADELFSVFVERLKSINQELGIIARPLLAALSSLAHRLPDREELAHQLAQELAQNDRSNAIDASSPVSDNMANQVQIAEGEVSEQIEKLLASGNSIDHPTMNRLFRNIVPRLEAGWAKSDDTARVFTSLLGRLRVFDTQHFDKLMADWVSHVRALKVRPPLPDLFPLMVTLGCLSISTMLHTANASPPSSEVTQWNPESTPYGSATYMQELLRLIITKLPTTNNLSLEEVYRFNIQQQSAKSENSQALLLLIRNAIVEHSALNVSQGKQLMPLDEPAYQDAMMETFKFLIVIDSNAVAECLCNGTLSPGATKMIHTIITNLLVPGGDGAGQTSFDRLLRLANELTMPFCQLKLNLDLSASEKNPTEGDDQNASRFDVFVKAMDHAIEAKNIMWTTMLPCLSEDITQHLNHQAHSKFLDLLPSPKSSNVDEECTSDNRIQLAENLLAVIEAICSGQQQSKSTQLTNALAEKLSDLWEIVSTRDKEKSTVQVAVLNHWLPAVMRFITLHSSSLETLHTAALGSAAGKGLVPPNHETRARIVLILCGLLLDLEALPQKATGTLPEHVFDIAALLADALPDDLRMGCAKAILLMPGMMPSTNGTTSDPRLYYLLSVPQLTPADNLRLAHRDKSAMPQSATARSMSAMYGIGASQDRYRPFLLRRWEVLSEPTPNVGENDTSLSLGLFEAIKIQ